jgi:HSP90 family molecular chaperone
LSKFLDSFVSIDEYIKNMKPGQDKIYFILAPTKDAADNSPFIETFK